MGCEKNNLDSKGLTDGFCLMINDEVVLNHYDIDYYDFSEHEVHLNNKVTFPDDTIKSGSFTVYANMDSIYSGHIIPSYSSYLFPGPQIHSQPLLIYNTYFPIDCVRMTDTSGNITPDPRGDERIIEALKKYNQFRE